MQVPRRSGFRPDLVFSKAGMLKAGQKFDKYTVVRLLGAGGMAKVYEAESPFGVPIVLKVLDESLLGHDEVLERFRREGMVQYTLKHPHIVRVTDIVEEQGVPALVIDFLKGQDLEAALERGLRLTLSEIVDVLIKLLDALQLAHDHKFYHRDIKPSNIFLETTDIGFEPRLMDFGIAKVAEGTALTRAQEFVGTPAYASPEQIESTRDVDARTDIYSMGVVLWQLLGGKEPYADKQTDVYSILVAVVREPLGDLPEKIPQWLRDITSTATAKNPDERFADCLEFKNALVEGAKADPLLAETMVLDPDESDSFTLFPPIATRLPEPVDYDSPTELAAEKHSPSFELDSGVSQKTEFIGAKIMKRPKSSTHAPAARKPDDRAQAAKSAGQNEALGSSAPFDVEETADALGLSETEAVQGFDDLPVFDPDAEKQPAEPGRRERAGKPLLPEASKARPPKPRPTPSAAADAGVPRQKPLTQVDPDPTPTTSSRRATAEEEREKAKNARNVVFGVAAVLILGALFVVLNNIYGFFRTVPDGFVKIEAATFTMGTPPNEEGHTAAEAQHEVTLTYDFAMQVHEVTIGEYHELMGRVPAFDECGENCPAVGVSWWEALEYANAYSIMHGVTPCYTLSGAGRDRSVEWSRGLQCAGYRLPTEAEWELAARAGNPRATSAGAIEVFGRDVDPLLDDIAWYGANSEVDYLSGRNCSRWNPAFERCGPQPVGQKAPNAHGLYDMHGNAAEWVWDYAAPYPTEAVTDPTGPDEGTDRIVRGGSWFDPARDLRSGARTESPPISRDTIGFRLVRTL